MFMFKVGLPFRTSLLCKNKVATREGRILMFLRGFILPADTISFSYVLHSWPLPLHFLCSW